MRKDVPRNFAKFTGKHLCQGLLFNKVVGLRPAALLKKRLWHWCFPVNFAKRLRTLFLAEHLWATASEENISQSSCTRLLTFQTSNVHLLNIQLFPVFKGLVGMKL